MSQNEETKWRLEAIEAVQGIFGTFESFPYSNVNAHLNVIEHDFNSDNVKCANKVRQSVDYKPARLVHHDYDLSKRWYVEFYAHDFKTSEARRKRIYINKAKSLNSRIEFGNQVVRQVNTELRAGKGFNRLGVKPDQFNTNKATLTEAIQFVHDQKKDHGLRNESLKNFRVLITVIKDFYDPRLKNADKAYFRDFYVYLKHTRQVGATTINNYRANLGTVIKFLNDRFEHLRLSDPVKATPKLKTVSKKHTAYTDSQIRDVLKECEGRGYHQLKLFISVIYYTLARPNEVQNIKVGDIDVSNRKIRLAGETAKSWKEESVMMPEGLLQVIENSGVLSYPPDYYLFSQDQKPGPQKIYKNGFWYRHHKVLKAVGLQGVKNHSLYSYKHTGAIALYKATKDITLVQRQCRHSNVQQTSFYLRDLGIIEGYDKIIKFKGAI